MKDILIIGSICISATVAIVLSFSYLLMCFWNSVAMELFPGVGEMSFRNSVLCFLAICFLKTNYEVSYKRG